MTASYDAVPRGDDVSPGRRPRAIGHFDERLRLLPDEPVSCPQPDELRRAA
jgi:hypothetical protein